MKYSFLKKLIIIIGICYFNTILYSQDEESSLSQLGFTGLIYTPSAYLNKWKTLNIGFTHYSKETSFTYRSGEVAERSFLATLAFLPFAEISLNLARPYSNIRPGYLAGTDDQRNWGIGDRSYSLRVRLIKETEKKPSILIGIQDPIGTGYFRTNYLVLSKSKTWNDLSISASTGYGWAKESRRDYLQGIFGGIQATWKQLYATAEYDTQQVNLGVGCHFKNRVFLNVAFIDAQYFSGNISFRFNLK